MRPATTGQCPNVLWFDLVLGRAILRGGHCPGGVFGGGALLRVPEDAVKQVLGTFVHLFQRQFDGSHGVFLLDRIVDGFQVGFIWSSGMWLGTAVKGVKSGWSVKQSNMGVAVASSWFIGGKPRISSIVRTRLVWL